ncbi:MAG: GTPase domain-containing protein [Gemmataceae bacterium]|nr:GTPase domain-containing protein [Gemmataceae bacterium]
MTAPAGPLLRTLVPALRGLERGVGEWIASPTRRPLAPLVRANLEGLRDDLRRRAEDLDGDQPLLVVVFMGGTGVGKSTLLNALAGSAIAQASFTRPTTRDPVVYHHNSIKPERLDPALRRCRLVAHDREELREKVLVDTPDLDSNEEENRERLLAVLPTADVVLYVGSQEKYHDRLGWDLFKAQRQRRAFAFVLNKWDRCSRPVDGGLRPDEDLRRDLIDEGFAEPLIFRTAAQYWVDKSGPPPEGEQFPELVRWLEEGLTRLEIEALKARGVEQLMEQVIAGLEQAKPPDLAEPARATRPVWEKLLDTESEDLAESLVNTLDPQQREIEHHFRVTGQQRFQRLMAAYLGLITWLQFAGSRLRNPAGAITGSTGEPAEREWDVTGLTRGILADAGRRGLQSRLQTMTDRMLVSADGVGFPPDLLKPRLDDLAALDWPGQLRSAVGAALSSVESDWTNPKGGRKLMQSGLVFIANIVPEVVFVGAVLSLLWYWFMKEGYALTLGSALMPFVLTLAVLMVFHILIVLLLPLRWPAIRGQFLRRLTAEGRERIGAAYLPAPEAVAGELAAERKKVEGLIGQVSELMELLNARRQAARIDALYGR